MTNAEYAERVLELAAEATGVTVAEMRSPRRDAIVVPGRMVACCVLYERGYTVPQIGHVMGRNTATITRILRVARQRVVDVPLYRQVFDHVREGLNGNVR